MSPKFANLKPEEVTRALKKGGFYIHETSGSHVQTNNEQGLDALEFEYYYDSKLSLY